MTKKTVHIISHSHWDREWYIPFEKHQLRLVQLIDDVLDLFDSDPEFKYFHLDGQTIVLDDYLEIRPNQRERVQKAITDGKLRIGPFYITQDAFLISGEANTRNALIGRKESRKWGVDGENISYFPDTFGLPGQIPQMSKLLELDTAAYGRGVKPTGLRNEIGEAYTSTYSEMRWEGADGSEILGILFANWYSNGNEIPVDKKEAKEFWDTKLADAEKYAATDQLLMMNGCDHQPVQKDLSEAIRVANELYPDYEFIHSNFNKYIEAVKEAVPEELSTVKGELRSQETDGWYTLANTSSIRTYLKQRANELLNRLEQVIEPMATIAAQWGYTYPHDQLEFAWKVLLQNFPHDSICGCSIDEVHTGMMHRFDKVEHFCNGLEEELEEFLTGRVLNSKAPEEAVNHFQVWNSTQVERTDSVELKVELERIYFRDLLPPTSYYELDDKEWTDLYVVDSQGNEVPAIVTNAGPRFGYDLPDDAFREPFMARYANVYIPSLTLGALSGESFYLVEGTGSKKVELAVQKEENVLENAYLKVTLEANGSVTLYDKVNEQEYKNQLVIEETGDVGNEYIFREANNCKRIYSTENLVSSEFVADGTTQTLELVYALEVPVSADELLDTEQKAVIDITNRKSGRSNELVKQELNVTLSLKEDAKGLGVYIQGNNEVKDHRYRLMFGLPEASDVHYADSSFEWVERSNYVSQYWENPTNPQTLRYSVSVENGEGNDVYGLTVSTMGIVEYEVECKDTNVMGGTQLGITFLRAVGELGDWGYFPTPDAQNLHEYDASFYVQPWTGRNQQKDTVKIGSTHFVDFRAYAGRLSQEFKESDVAYNSLINNLLLAELPNTVSVTAFKQKEDDEEYYILRLYNFGKEDVDLNPYLSKDALVGEVNLLENPLENASDSYYIRPHEIKSYMFKYK